MNLNALSSQSMLAHSYAWLHVLALRGSLEAHPLGAAALAQVQAAHDRLARTRNQRDRVMAELERLTNTLVAADQRYKRKARALHGGLDVLALIADDPGEEALFRDLQDTLFPAGLQLMQRSYLDKAGAAIEVRRRVTAAMRARLAAIPVGDQTLGDVYEEWIAAAADLGKLANERARLQASIGRAGSAAAGIDGRKARHQWIRSVLLLVQAMGFLPLDAKTRERLLAPLERSIREAGRARSGVNSDAGAGSDADAGSDAGAGSDAEAAGAGERSGERAAAPLIGIAARAGHGPPRLLPARGAAAPADQGTAEPGRQGQGTAGDTLRDVPVPDAWAGRERAHGPPRPA